MQTSKASLPVMSIQGEADHPIMSGDGYRVGYDGYGRIPMTAGGTIYNYEIGDSCIGIAGDYIGPGVSLKNPVEKESNALQTFTCIGNEAKVISGDTEGREGYVTEKHGGVDHVTVCFDEETLELMTTEDKALIKVCGQGLGLTDRGETQLVNVDPALFEGLGVAEEEQGIKVLVVTCVPAHPMGSGLGSATTMLGDHDITMRGAQTNKEFGINELHFGDLIAIQSHDNHNGPYYRRGTVSVGIAVHTDSYTGGHGPGLTAIMNSQYGSIEPILDPNASIANYLHIK